jgi:hypothetical protein
MKRGVTRIIDNNTFCFTSESDDGEFLDTRVTLNGIDFCWITFSDLEDFMKDFSNFISKYRI